MKSLYKYFFEKREGETISIGYLIIFGASLITALYFFGK